MNTFYFNNVSAESKGLVASGGQTFNSPERSQQMVQIPGRNGDLILDGGRWNNLDITYHVYCVDFLDNRDDITSWLMEPGYHKLEDEWDTDHFRIACFRGPVKWDTFLARHGETDLVFSAKPQKYLNSGTTVSSFTADGTISNPTAFDARPLLRVYGTGKVTINGTEITITTANSYTDIDCELMDCFKGTTNCNLNVSLDEFPVLSPGSNTIDLNGVTKVEITPRWWEL